MKCPMKFNVKHIDADGSQVAEATQCEKEDCAWFDGYLGICCVASGAYRTGAAEHLADIRAERKADRENQW